MSDLIRYWRDRIEQAKPGLVVIDPDTLSTLLDRVETAERERDLCAERFREAANDRHELLKTNSLMQVTEGAAGQALQRVRELHAKHENTIHTRPEWICSHRHCVDDAGDQNAWPCPTIQALDSPSL